MKRLLLGSLLSCMLVGQVVADSKTIGAGFANGFAQGSLIGIAGLVVGALITQSGGGNSLAEKNLSMGATIGTGLGALHSLMQETSREKTISDASNAYGFAKVLGKAFVFALSSCWAYTVHKK